MKRLLCLLLVIIMLSACSGNKPVKEGEFAAYQGKDFINELKNFKVREKNEANIRDDEDFDVYLNEVFAYYVGTTYLNMHNNVVDYQQYGITKPDVRLGELNYGEKYDNSDEVALLEKLKTFDYDQLSYRQQYDYEVMEYSFYETLASYFYADVMPLFAISTDLFGNLPTIFTEFGFYNQESVDDYLLLLQDVDRYIDDALAYGEKQATDGIYATDYSLDYELNFIEGFIAKTTDNELIVSFDKAIGELAFLDEQQKAAYCLQNREIVLREVLPAFVKAAEVLPTYYGKVKDQDAALYKYSPEYAELYYLLNGSDNRNIDILFNELKDSADYDAARFFSCLYNNQVLQEVQAIESGNYPANMPDADFANMLQFLQAKLSTVYPELPAVDYVVSKLDPSLAKESVLAYYVPGPLDDINRNAIRVNPLVLQGSSLLPAYFTLAHEGFPGHLYQNVSYLHTSPHPFRSIIEFIAYTEGFAVMAQKEAIAFLDLQNEETAFALFYDDAYYFKIYSVIDIGVNYYGWSDSDIEHYLSELGVFGDASGYGPSFRSILTAMPGIYCAYGLGAMNYERLQAKAQQALNDNYDSVVYYEYLLKNGPLPFVILEKAVDEYINNTK